MNFYLESTLGTKDPKKVKLIPLFLLRFVFLVIALTFIIMNMNVQARATRTVNDKIFVGYFESWSERRDFNSLNSQLANLPSYVNVVNLAFMKPDANYRGQLDITDTGIEFFYDGYTLKKAIQVLRSRNPNTKILVSVGGETYRHWESLNAHKIANFIRDFALDGIDIDYEPRSYCRYEENSSIICATDQQYVSVIQTLRQVLPRPLILSVAGASVGAYGEGSWKDAQPQSMRTGMMLAVFRSSAATAIDLINVMSYDAGDSYNPKQALQAYQHYFRGKIAMGVEVPPEAWGGHIYTIAKVKALADEVNSHNASGMMLWSIQKKPDMPVSADYPNAQMIAETICQKLNLGECQHSLLR